MKNVRKDMTIKRTLELISLRMLNIRPYTTGAWLSRMKLDNGNWAWVIDEFDEGNCDISDSNYVPLESKPGPKTGGIIFDIGRIKTTIVGKIIRGGDLDGAVVIDVSMCKTKNIPLVSLHVGNDPGSIIEEYFQNINWEGV